jgi:alpha-1,2-mannosyltransferase
MSGLAQEGAGPPVVSHRARSFDRRSLEQRVLLVSGLIALSLSGLTLYNKVRNGTFGFDFRGSLWKAGGDILAGRSPYPAPNAAELAHVGNAYVYPPLAAFVSLPLALIAPMPAAVVWSILNGAALVAALWVVGVRDWRCYVAFLASLPVLNTLALGQMNGLLVLAIAFAWRFRDRAVLGGAAAGLAIALKLLAWPLVFWFLFTRRFRAALVSLATAAALTLGSWAVIGFRGLTTYPSLVAADAKAFEDQAHSIVTLAVRVGLSATGGRALAALATFSLLALVYRESRAGTANEAFTFGVALLGGLLGSPVLHQHYLVVTFLALAAARPFFDWRWLLLFGFWVSPIENRAQAWQIAVVLALALCVVWSTRERSEPSVVPDARATNAF